MNSFFTIILSIVNIIVIIILPLIFKNYFPSYFSEKGKNLAQKEDIAKITTIVEQIKSEHIKNQEQIKSQLSLAVSRNNDIDIQARKAVLDFYDKSIEFIGTKFAINFGNRMGTIEEHVKFIKEYDRSIFDDVTQIYKLYYRLFIYFDTNSSIMKTASSVLICILDLKKVYEKYFPNFKTSFLHEVENLSNIDRNKYRSCVDDTNAASKEYYGHLNPLLKTSNETFNLYINEVNKFLNINNSIKI